MVNRSVPVRGMDDLEDCEDISVLWQKLDQVQSAPVIWAIDRVIPAGQLTLLTGEAGIGASLLAADLIARVTRGETRLPVADLGDEPDAEESTQRTEGLGKLAVGSAGPGSVILLTRQTHLADVIRPRVAAAGGNPSLIYSINGMQIHNDQTKQVAQLPFLLEKHLSTIVYDLPFMEEADGIPIKMMVIDTIDQFLGSGCKAHEVEEVARQLTSFAACSGIAVVVVGRLPRANQDPAAYLNHKEWNLYNRVIGAEAKSVWTVLQDPLIPQRRVLWSARALLGESGPVRAFMMMKRGIVWEEQPIAATASEWLASTKPRKGVADPRSELSRAIEWLSARLGQGSAYATDIEEESSKKCFSKATIRRAFHWLPGNSDKETGSGKWVWSLPKPESEARQENLLEPNGSVDRIWDVLQDDQHDQGVHDDHRVEDVGAGVNEKRDMQRSPFEEQHSDTKMKRPDQIGARRVVQKTLTRRQARSLRKQQKDAAKLESVGR